MYSAPNRPEELRRMLTGDLDNIIMMAMRKEPHRRYPCASDLGDDIGRYLEGLPVSARKDTPSTGIEIYCAETASSCS